MSRSLIAVNDLAEPYLRDIAAQLARPQALYKDVGRGVANHLKRHFRERNLEPNKRGWAKQGFWGEIRDAVQQPIEDERGVDIAINDSRLAAKIYGARITPKNARALTIPVHELGYGRRASVFEDETGKELFRPLGKRVLMAEIGGKPVAIYALASSANVPRDPRALPPEDELLAGILKTADAHLARMLARGGQGGE